MTAQPAADAPTRHTRPVDPWALLAHPDHLDSGGPMTPRKEHTVPEQPSIDLRAGGTRQAVERIRAALADPDAGAAYLAAVFNDAGARDTALALTAAAAGGAAGERWEQLAAAARAAGRHALAGGGRSAHGPLTVLALTRWAAGDLPGAHRMCAAVPVQDASRRFADLIARTSASTDFGRWAATVAAFDHSTTMAFHRPPTPGTPPPAGAADWFAEPPQPTTGGSAEPWEQRLARCGQAMAARGWSMHVTDQIDLGDGIAWTGVLRRRGGTEALVTCDGRGGAPMVRFAERPARHSWQADLAAAGIDEEAAIAGLDLVDIGRPIGQPPGTPPPARGPGRTAATPAAHPGSTAAGPPAPSVPRPRTTRGPAR